MVAKAYHSGDSEADNSQTPWWIIRQIQDVANVKIKFDVCAEPRTAKAPKYFTKEDDALSRPWSILKGNSALWMNPPFSLASEFTTKAADEAQRGCVIIACVKHAPDATWFQEMEKRATFIYVPDGRVNFRKPDGAAFKHGANFPLCFPIWTPFNSGNIAEQIRFKRDKAGYELDSDYK